jgi:serine/threonine protein kinase
MLTNLLELNPFFRCSAAELLKNPIFNCVRKTSGEKSAPFKINLEIDRDDAFDYETGCSDRYAFNDY